MVAQLVSEFPRSPNVYHRQAVFKKNDVVGKVGYFVSLTRSRLLKRSEEKCIDVYILRNVSFLRKVT